MAKKVDTFQPKISRNDRFAQMSQQEKIIEQKKKEILAKLEAKEIANKAESTKSKEPTKTGNKRYNTLNFPFQYKILLQDNFKFNKIVINVN